MSCWQWHVLPGLSPSHPLPWESTGTQLLGDGPFDSSCFLSVKLSGPHGNSLGVIASEPSAARLRDSLTLGLEEEEHGGS